jgi:hypothetical protein
MDPPTERWLVFPTFDQRMLAELVEVVLAEQKECPDLIIERSHQYVGDLLLALNKDI